MIIKERNIKGNKKFVNFDPFIYCFYVWMWHFFTWI